MRNRKEKSLLKTHFRKKNKNKLRNYAVFTLFSQIIDKILWKNHKNSDLFPEFNQNCLFLRGKNEAIWKEK